MFNLRPFFESLSVILGMTLAERWNTDNTLSTEVVIDDKLLKGLKLVLDTAYAPYVGYLDTSLPFQRRN